MGPIPQPLETTREVPHEEPQDLGFDRRSFLQRFAAVSAAAASGSVGAFWSRPAHATVARTGWIDPYKDSVRPEALADPTELTASEASFLIRARKLAPITLVEAYLDRIERFDAIYEAFNTVTADEARAAAALRQTMLDTFAGVGAEIVDVTLPDEWDLLTGNAFDNVRLPERTEPFLEFMKQDLKLFGVSLNGWMQGLFLSADEFLKGQRAKYRLLERVLGDLYAQCDVVVQTSPVPFDILGLPEIAFPIGFAPNASGVELPVGAILGGKPFGEDRLCALVAAYQAVTGFHLERPSDPVLPDARFAARAFAAEPLRISAEEVEADMQ
jgi:Asp-tRNA(Asn)/Glu-tRNA(Gln) amidotransferase A subunit family amidase